MNVEFYRLLHPVAALLLFLSIGAVLAAPKDGRPPRWAMITHGLALLVMVVAGVGIVHKDAAVDWGNWLYAKIGCWVLLAALPVLLRKGVLPRTVGGLLAIGLAGAAVWLAQTKPF